MKLTKKLKEEIMQVYDTWMHAYLNGDIKTYDHYLAEEYRFIGSTNNEEFLNRKNTTNFFKATAEQLSGKTELRNRTRTIQQIGEFVFITDVFDAWFLNGTEWAYYGRFRFSSALQMKENGWRFVYQHFSTPDSKAQEGETIAYEKVTDENLQLREAIKRRTVELEHKNRELEIETALEKVRTIAMGMKEPADMPEVCKIISLQLQSLGVEGIRNVQTAIFYESRGTYMNYEYYTKHKKAIITETGYSNNKIHKAFAAKMMKGKGEFFVTHIKGKKVKDWIAYQKTTNVFIDRFLTTATSLNYYWHSLGPVALGVSTYEPLSKEDLSLFKRFLNVFELAYTRYLDIEKALAQAREAQIEVAVERVRAKALAMHKSTEILGVVVTMQKELRKLNISGVTAATIYLSEENGRIRTWDFTTLNEKEEDFQLRMDFVFRLEETDQGLWIRRIWNSKKKYAVIEQDEKDFVRLLKFLRAFDKAAGNNVERLIKKYKIKHSWHPTVQLAQGRMNVDFIEPPPAEMEFILPKMGAAFDLAYKRFRDLQKAEVQTKEARIEAALERMRAAAMSMHKSEDLIVVSKAMYKELTALGFGNIRNAQISTKDPSGQSYFVTEYSDYVSIAVAESQMENSPLVKNIYEEMERSSDAFYQREFSGKQFRDWRKWRLSIAADKDPRILEASSMWFYLYSTGQGFLGISTFGLISAEQTTILKRFRNVFEFSFRRYMDVAHAEVQAREAQIELALERVRARTMAMQNSEELSETVAVLFEQFSALGEAPERMAIEIVNEKENVFEIWATQHGGSKLNLLLKVSLDEPHVMQKMYKAWKQKKKSITIDLQGNELDEYFQYLKKAGLPVQRKIFGKRRVQNVATFSKGILTIITPEPRPVETIQLLERFAAVFDGTYTRFLDLQNAEAQAKEAQIEAALERVRARSMAMHKSEELKEVIQVVYDQFVHLKVNTKHTGFVMDYKQRDDRLIWVASEYGVPSQLTIPHFDSEYYNRFNEAKEKGWDFFATNLSFEQKNHFYKELFKHIPDLPGDAKEFYFKCPGLAISTVLLENVGLYIENFEGIPYSDEDNAVLMRFGKVFQQTYTRFLDLQKAEAQAREAEIELALERIRARTMAMQNSDELIETAVLLFDQLKQLGERIERTIIGVINEEEHVVDFWATRPGGTHMDKMQKFPLDEPVVIQRVYAAWKQQKKSIVIDLRGEEFERYFQFLKARNPKMQRERFGERLVEIFAIFSKGFLGAVNVDLNAPVNVGLYERFAAVFDQTYTRFLDLQKAEAQAREAKIEAALERVRSASMAMHSSDELQKVIRILTDQLTILGFEFHTANFITNASMPDWEIWISSPGSNIPPKLFVPYFNHRLFNERNDAVTSGKDMLTVVLSPEEKSSFLNYFFEHSGAKQTDEDRIKWVLDQPGMALTTVVTKSFSLSVINYYGKLYTESENEVIKRLAHVFEQSYTRFLDLQKAEAQARQAKIEAAMEKVRSRAMAMQKPDELVEVAELLRREMGLLGVEELETSSIYIHHEEIGKTECWYAIKDVQHPEKELVSGYMTIDLHETSVGKRMLEFYHSGKKQLSIQMQGDARKEWINYCAGHSKVLEGFYGGNIPDRTYHLYKFPNGYMGAASPGDISSESWELLQRATTVFSLAYTRFNDLQQAEAQAREAKIEAALEKVRSRSLAMHKSDELEQVATVVLSKLLELGFVIDDGAAVHLNIFTEGTRDFVQWSADPVRKETIRSNVPFTNLPLFTDFFDAKEKGLDFLTKVYSFEEKNEWFNYAFEYSDFKYLPDDLKQVLLQSERYEHWIAIEKNSALVVNSVSGSRLSDIQIEILKRFARVFEQAYVRFLDLQKAEAQAREAQIETALERVRSRSMAMHSSNELKEVITVIMEQFKQLGFYLDLANFNINSTKDWSMWLATPDYTYPEIINIPYIKHPLFDNPFKALKNGLNFFSDVLTQEEKDSVVRHLYANTALGQWDSEERKKYVFEGKGFARSVVFMKHIILTISNYSAIPYNDEQNLILKRFAKVFEQSYTRFLDLQKAEAQAKEAQIEASLERVRARTMAMQHSDELAEVVGLLYKQFEDLDFGLYQILVSIIDIKNNVVEWWSRGFSEIDLPQRNLIPIIDHPFSNAQRERWESGTPYYAHILGGDTKKSWEEYLFTQTDLKNFPQQVKDQMRSLEQVYLSDAFMKHGVLQAAGPAPLPDDKAAILIRFAKVLDLAYTRMTDLQNAEAQAREARIELALERVRARTMAMQHSDELKSAASLLFQQVKSLGVPAYSCGYNIWEKEDKEFTSWMSTQDGSDFNGVTNIPLTEDANFIRFADSRQKSEQFFVLELRGKRMQEHYKYLKTIPAFKAYFDYAISVGFDLPETQIHHLANFSQGNLLFITLEPCPEFHDVFKRFATVFEQTYTRFLDLQKAEAQAREAKIEAALEKVRSRSLAMHKSEELGELVAVLYEKMTELGVISDGININVIKEGTRDFESWLAAPGQSYAVCFQVPYFKHHVTDEIFEAIDSHKELLTKVYTFEEKTSFFTYLYTNTNFKYLPEDRKKLVLESKNWEVSIAFAKNTALSLHSYSGKIFSDHENEILKRFAKVFEQSYTRFLDLQNAEAQTREAKIEAALEKVRSSSMAMHKSDELHEVINVVTEQFQQLGFRFDTANFITNYTDDGGDWWISTPGVSTPANMYCPSADIRFFNNLAAIMRTGVDFFTESFSFEEKNEFFDYVFENTKLKHIPEERKQYIYGSSGIASSSVVSKNVILSIANYQLVPYTEEENAILKRVGKVFEQSYTRFLDLQKAEAQARKAQIEAALERIRAKAMSMHRSEELDEVLEVLFDQFDILGIAPMSTHMTLIDLETNTFTFRETGKGGRRSFGEQVVAIDSMDIWKNEAEKWRTSEPLSINRLHFPKESLPMVWQVFHESFASMPEDAKITPEDYPDGIYHTAGNCKFGYIGMNQIRKATEEEEQIVLKFATEFGRLYQRFLDLKKAEAQAKEAKIEASLERVRSKAMAMHSSQDLANTIVAFYHELELFSITPRRCGVGLINKETHIAELSTMNTTEQGRSIEIIGKIKLTGHPVLEGVFDNWLLQKEYYPVLRGNEIKVYYELIRPQIQFPDYPNDVVQYGYFFYFPEGGVYAWTDKEMAEDELKIYRRFTSVLSLTYKRYKDLQQAEELAHQAEEDLVNLKIEKQRTEEALAELQVTQKQLVQSEKMASLGELTAGIAHEIQNPLNFVNNFSEVSNELLDEMMEEVVKGNYDEVKAIVNDVKQNLEKINHHGKRADSIVKGMLQHSRSSSATKEPTDINKLAEEYLRLAYHGLRAKDKTFNATMKTDFDETTGSISIFPQDIGRVILNLITNAFYAVTEKKKLGRNGYEPTVSVSTKKVNGNVEVSVKDNGNGIPQKILDKIFQPFFTTKPTGQGTGLGLSLSYDIVKAHVGELKVQTKDGEGSEFIIVLPV